MSAGSRNEESRRATILIADDEPSIRFVLREALEAEGHSVEEVGDGDRALELLATGRFDVAFLDIRMPGLSGLELPDQMRATGSETAAVVSTAVSTIGDAGGRSVRSHLARYGMPASLRGLSPERHRCRAFHHLAPEPS